MPTRKIHSEGKHTCPTEQESLNCFKAYIADIDTKDVYTYIGFIQDELQNVSMLVLNSTYGYDLFVVSRDDSGVYGEI